VVGLGVHSLQIPEDRLVFGEAILVASGRGIGWPEAIENVILLDDEVLDAGELSLSGVGFRQSVPLRTGWTAQWE
jgi:hypothetical protein